MRTFVDMHHGQVLRRDIKEFLYRERGKKLSEQAIGTHLKKSMRYSKKKPSQYNAKALG